MLSRSFLAVVLTILGLFGGAGAVLAYDSAQRDQIANGISVGGIDVGGLSAGQARSRLGSEYLARFVHPVVLRFGARRFILTARAAHVRVDVEASVRQAVWRSREANLLVRVFRSLSGGRIVANIDPQVQYSGAAVKRIVTRIAGTLDRPARDASIAYTGNSIGNVPSQTGRRVGVAWLTGRVQTALTDVRANRRINIHVTRTLPRMTTRQLAARYPTVITIDRAAFTLRLWKQLRLVKSYTIAVGRIGLQTPAGLYHVQDKQVDPSWHVPNSSWAGSLAGQTIPPGPQDPLKARWMGIYNGAGIHGTDALSSLGTAASHGCIRMAIPDVIELYDQTPLGTPVYIA